MSAKTTAYSKFYDYSLFDKESISTVSEYLCPLCSGVLYNAVVDICGHVFCQSCIHAHLVSTKTKTCPINKTIYIFSDEDQIVHPLPLIRSIVNKQKIKCKNKCEWIGPAGDLGSHLDNDCVFSILNCAYSSDGCPVQLMRNEKVNHEKECRFKPKQCEHCGEKIGNKFTKEHENVCPNFLVECKQKCGYLIERKDLKSHMEATCENTMLDCIYFKLGCTGRFARKEEAKHYEGSKVSHSGMIVQSLVEAIDSIEEIKKKVEGENKKNNNNNDITGSNSNIIQPEIEKVNEETEKKEDRDILTKKINEKEEKKTNDSKFTGKKRGRPKKQRNESSDSEDENSSKIISEHSFDSFPNNVLQKKNNQTEAIIGLPLDTVNISKGIQVNGNRALTLPLDSSSTKPEHKFVFANLDLNKTEIEWKVIRIKKNGWLGIGACVKEIVIGNNYKFTPNVKGFDHGCFMMSSNGYTWNRNCEDENKVLIDNKEIPEILNNPGCEVILKYSQEKRNLQITVSNFTLMLKNVFPQKDMQLVPCVVLLKEGEEIMCLQSS